MSKGFGQKSYRFANAAFFSNGRAAHRRTFGAVGTVFSKNILIETSGSLSAVEAVAIALARSFER